MKQGKLTGHLLALLVIAVWGTTYVATELLLDVYSAIQIMILRFVLAFVTLFLLRPKPYLPKSAREEGRFLLLGLFGVIVYYLTENLAISRTDGTNVSILICFAPIFTILGNVIRGKSKLTRYTLFGFAVAITGVILVVFNGTVHLSFDPAGYLFALGSAASWAVYSLLLDGSLGDGFDSILLTRRMLLYSLLLLLPYAAIRHELPPLAPLKSLPNALSLGVLGALGGSICYLWWNQAMQKIGVVVTTNYLYLSPFVTMLCAYFVTGTRVSAMGAVGTLFIIGGVILSDKKQGI